MKGQMCWLPHRDNNSKIMLHLREYPYQSWRPYTSYSQYSVPDYPVPGGSKGWATYQKLREAGWTLIASDRAYSTSEFATFPSKKS
jgi:hypothetical protein